MCQVYIGPALTKTHSSHRNENWIIIIDMTGSSLAQKLIRGMSGRDHQSIHSWFVISKLSYSLE